MTGAPSPIFWIPETISRSPGSSPPWTTYVLPTMRPSVTGRWRANVPPSPSSARNTKYWPLMRVADTIGTVSPGFVSKTICVRTN